MNAPAATMQELLERGAARRGDAPFIIDPASGRATSYARMHELALATAAALARRGLVPGDNVGLFIDNSVELVAAILGALHGGFVAAPLNPGAGRAALVHALAHADARVLLVGRAHLVLVKELAEAGPPVETVEAEAFVAGASTQQQPAAPASAAHAGGLLLYTSGSTGRPKGVLLSHASVLARAQGDALARELGTDDRFPCVLPLQN